MMNSKIQTGKVKNYDEKLRRGYTTGTCAQATTKGAVTMLLGNVSVDQGHSVFTRKRSVDTEDR